MEEKICYLIGAGVFGEEMPPLRPEDFVIAGDGGLRHCEARGIVPHFIIGDFDSLGYLPEGEDVCRLPVEKDDTDMWAAMEEGWKRGYRHFRLYGGTGGRISHTIANIQLLTEISSRGGCGLLVGENFSCRVIGDGGRYCFDESERGTLSVFCLGDTARGVNERGLKYSLTDAVLTKEYPLGVSNEFVGQAGEVSVAQGFLLLIKEW